MKKYGGSEFPHARELLPLLQSGAATVQTLEFECGLAKDAFDRTMERIRLKWPTAQLPARLESIDERFNANPHEQCRMWRFQVAGNVFWVFEMVRSKQIAGCVCHA